MKSIILLLSQAVFASPTFPPEGVEVELREVGSTLEEEIRRLEEGPIELYRELHANPELSFQEVATAREVAERLRSAGYEVTEEVGRTGVVAMLRNGEGPTVMVRGDMDALPITEATGLDYASEVTAERNGEIVGVMHACGHDLHTTTLVATAEVLAAARGSWSGTAMIVAQPAEEIGLGAKEMLEDGLFERFATPDFIIGLHVAPELPAGSVGLTPGWANANVDTVEITVHGRGGHGARPHQAADPIVAASSIVVGLQSVVSRRLDPASPGVITVGSIHGGSKSNVIPDEANLALTVRSYDEASRQTLLQGIREVAAGTCEAMGCAAPPTVVQTAQNLPAAFNHVPLTEAAQGLFEELFGGENVHSYPASLGGEDFGRYSRASGRPGLQLRLGVVSRELFDANGEPTETLPSLHSPLFRADPEPSIRTGVTALSNLALRLLAEPAAE